VDFDSAKIKDGRPIQIKGKERLAVDGPFARVGRGPFSPASARAVGSAELGRRPRWALKQAELSAKEFWATELKWLEFVFLFFRSDFDYCFC